MAKFSMKCEWRNTTVIYTYEIHLNVISFLV